MDVSEFKAWFEGFTEDMSGQPNTKQWKRIKARVEQIDRYWGRYQPYLTVPTTWSSTGTSNVPNNFAAMTAVAQEMNVNSAFTALGKAEATFIAA